MRRIPSYLALLSVLLLVLSGCAAFSQRDPLNVQVAGIQPLPGEGLELRMNVKLRIQNPNDMALDYNGVALDLEVNGRRLASGVSDARGSVPGLVETVLSEPVTCWAFSAARQALGLAEHIGLDEVPYVLRGKLAGGLFGTQRFVEKGTLELPDTLASPYRRTP